MSFSDEAFFDSITPTARYGEEEAAAPAPAQGGGGGGGGGAVVGQVLGAVSGIIGGVASGIAGAVDQQAQPAIMAKVHSKRLQRALAGLSRVMVDHKRQEDRYRTAARWLNNPANKLKWVSTSFAKSLPGLRPNDQLCPPLFLDNLAAGSLQQQPGNPGGHAGFPAGPACACPTAKCAYKPNAHTRFDGMRLQAQDAQAKMRLIAWNRLGTIDAPHALNTGNINKYRTEALISWSFLMSLEGMREVLFAAGLPALWQTPGTVYDPNTIKDLFASTQARREGWEPDPEGKRGVVPAVMGATLIQQLLTMYGMGIVPSAVPVPLWALGFTKAEQGRYTTGPTVGQVARVNEVMWGNTPQYSGLVTYGAAPAPDGLRAHLKAMVKSGQIRTVPQAQPSAVPGATALVAPGMAPDADALRADAARMSTGAKVALSVGAGVTLLGMTALLIKVARS